MLGVTFEWDEHKALSNLRKHRVSFDEAKLALLDPGAIVEPDESDPTEERWRTTGLAASVMLFVVTIEPDEHTIRIISARRATRHEQDRYHRQAHP